MEIDHKVEAALAKKQAMLDAKVQERARKADEKRQTLQRNVMADHEKRVEYAHSYMEKEARYVDRLWSTHDKQRADHQRRADEIMNK